MLRAIAWLMAGIFAYRSSKQTQDPGEVAWSAVKGGCFGIILYFTLGIMLVIACFLIEMSYK